MTSNENSDAYWYVFQNSRLLVKNDRESTLIPTQKDISELTIEQDSQLYLETLNNRPSYSAELTKGAELPKSLVLIGLRELFGKIQDDFWTTAGYALQLNNWNRDNQFCNKCGSPIDHKHDERAKICTNCQFVNYPRINPCIIVAITKGDKILLARSIRYPKRMLYSVIAGYVESGETLEECVRREVKEEVNLDVKNIRYFSSQQWPFTSALMVGFTAEYAGGDVVVEKEELIEAGWYSKENLPEVPGWGSISGRLIEWFASGESNSR